MHVKTSTFVQWCGIKKVIDGYVTGVCIDTRKIKPGDAFFAFKGERVNGEDYALDALDKGASIVVVSHDFKTKSRRIIRVADVQRVLQKTAKIYRRTLPVKIVGITGSVGKTSTKEMIKAVLKTKYKTVATRGNFNNEIGLPLMIFDIESTDEWAVLEMGMNHDKEIHRLADIARPTIAAITNIGTAHIEFFGSRHKIAKAKFEITDFLTPEDNLVLNGNDVMLRHYQKFKFKTHVVGAPFDEISYQNIKLKEDATTFDIKVNGKRICAKLPMIGEHHVQNAILAVKVGMLTGIDVKDAVDALANTQNLTMRFNIENIGKFKVINDAYNASQASIIASVKTFASMPYKKHIVVLGDVLETGKYTQDLHGAIGSALMDYPVDIAVFVGDAMAYAYESYKGEKMHFKTIKDVAPALVKLLRRKNDAALFKASRGMQFEKIIEELKGIINA